MDRAGSDPQCGGQLVDRIGPEVQQKHLLPHGHRLTGQRLRQQSLQPIRIDRAARCKHRIDQRPCCFPDRLGFNRQDDPVGSEEIDQLQRTQFTFAR